MKNLLLLAGIGIAAYAAYQWMQTSKKDCGCSKKTVDAFGADVSKQKAVIPNTYVENYSVADAADHIMRPFLTAGGHPVRVDVDRYRDNMDTAFANQLVTG